VNPVTLPTINRGTTYRFGFIYKKNGEPFDLTGSTVYFTVKRVEWDSVKDDATALLKQTKTEHENAVNGYTLFDFIPKDTWIDPGNWTFDIKVKEPNGDTFKPVVGKVSVSGAPTNRHIFEEETM